MKRLMETGTQAIAYTTGVPAMIGAMMVLSGEWNGTGVYNIEQLDPDGSWRPSTHMVCPGRWRSIRPFPTRSDT